MDWSSARPLTDLELAHRIIALARGPRNQGPGHNEASGSFERAITGLLLAIYKQGLRAIVGGAPSWVSEEILSASEHIEDDGAAVWMSEN